MENPRVFFLNLPVVLSAMGKLSKAISSRIKAFTLRADDKSKWSFGNRDRKISMDLQIWSLALWKLPELYSKTYKAYDKSSSAVATAKFLFPCIERLISNARYNINHKETITIKRFYFHST